MLIQDEIKTTDKESTTTRWALTTRAQIQLDDQKRSATLTQNKKSITMNLLAPETARFTTKSIEDPPHDFDATNPNTRQLAFDVNLPAQTTETLAVHFQSSEQPPPRITPLSEW